MAISHNAFESSTELAKACPLSTIGVVGAGVMGAGLAQGAGPGGPAGSADRYIRLGMHFMSPVPLKTTVEAIRGYRKAFCLKTAAKADRDAVQLHGAIGCINGFAPDRLFRDARLTEIIEGSNELHEITTAQTVHVEFSPKFLPAPCHLED